MTNTKVSTTLSRTRLFPATKWSEISALVADAFRMTQEERERFHGSRIAKLIGAIPFLAQCEDAERTAVAHLGTYLLSIRETKRYFNANREDRVSVLARLRLGSNFEGGEKAIIDRGLSLLALNMVYDYRRDAEEDVFLGKYNPVSEGDIDFALAIENLTRTIEAIPCGEMEEILPVQAAAEDFWNGEPTSIECD